MILFHIHVHFHASYTSITTLVYMYMHDSELLIAVNTDTLLTSDVDARQMLSIREPINGSHHNTNSQRMCMLSDPPPTHHVV